MDVVTRIYIFFSDGSSEAKAALNKINNHPSKDVIAVISVENDNRSAQALEILTKAHLDATVASEGRIKACFLVRDNGTALYPASDVATVLMLASRK